ncbi:ATP-binding cassette domain-containing protein [Demequina sp. B12]|uniref:ABC-F family ATP-binding cassette domain-containing protein n=1 Tax=Demequina sp. B12 TaxID=2992757 RepID=UPI00237BDD5E|nr:ABC-F family ATP-binding cassette domain-containing protein [Demequina sp. B12]MDE0572218.1 ATP-binding cassette domain-containing protein [Demequina sp. B12]
MSGSVDGGLRALVGANGAGKSTLLRILAGDLTPDSGTVHRPLRVAYVRQDVALDPLARADAAMGLASKRAAVRAIESGDVDPAHFDTVGHDWDVEERAVATLASLGLPDGTLDRTVGELSGGEITRLALAAALWERPEVLLLDEPTNNLDADATAFVLEALERRSGATLVVSHDRRVLRRVAAVGELRRGSLRWFGGNIEAYEAAIASERERAEAELANAKTQVAKQHRELRAHVEGAGKRQRDGERQARQAGVPKIMMGAMKRKAQATQARVTAVHEDRLGEAQGRLDAARAAARQAKEIRVDLPQTAVPARRDVASLDCRIATGTHVSALIQGPERIVLSGPNGSGKTTLLRTLLGEWEPLDGNVTVSVPCGYLPQRLDVLDPDRSVVDNVMARAVGAAPHEVREGLAKFLFRGDAGQAMARQLSGGERLRAALAAVLLARPAPQLLILDEPTNNLDFASRTHLLEALAGFQGAVIVVSHDAEFVEQLRPTRRWVVSGEGFTDRAWG